MREKATVELTAFLHDVLKAWLKTGPGRAARYAVLMTGPSASADIEGFRVRGAQGIRSLTVVVC